MKQFRERLTYGNVMSTVFVFLLLAGGTAIAAKQLGKKTVGAKQLKANAVTTAKIKKAAVTKDKLADGSVDATKIADGSVTTTKIADGAVTGAKIAAGSTSFSQRVARLQRNETVPITGALLPYPIGSFTQNAGEDQQMMGSVEFEFEAACTKPRSAQIYATLDVVNPSMPMPNEFIGIAIAQDEGTGAVRKTAPIASFPGISGSLNRSAPTAATSHKFDLYLVSKSCSAGNGVNVTGVTLDVIGTK